MYWKIVLRSGMVLANGFVSRLAAQKYHNEWLDSQNYDTYSLEDFDKELAATVVPDDEYTMTEEEAKAFAETENPNRPTITPKSLPNPQVINALRTAADRIGSNNYRKEIYKPVYSKNKLVKNYAITESHQKVIDTLNQYIAGKINDHTAMAVLHEHDVLNERTQKGE